ncbi:hypothetical protein F511_44781 [Dorcoceras hygrometricum]|uniref:Uncharacterized protein n=1 Tax=Dorcoceras hygrometricum TaxID=472368 RepID=A0A2Z7B6F2_9LAMI|nr:hypothetical protein F511_44781 [Dorcoceras hygrometricum]
MTKSHAAQGRAALHALTCAQQASTCGVRPASGRPPSRQAHGHQQHRPATLVKRSGRSSSCEAAPSSRRRRAMIAHASPVTRTLIRAAAPNVGLPCAASAQVARTRACEEEGRRRMRWRRGRGPWFKTSFSILKNRDVRYKYGKSYDQIRKTLALIPLLGS